MKDQSPLKDIHNPKQLRDELKLQTHLFKGDMAQEWKKLEKDLKEVMRTQSAPIKEAAKKSAKEMKTVSCPGTGDRDGPKDRDMISVQHGLS